MRIRAAVCLASLSHGGLRRSGWTVDRDVGRRNVDARDRDWTYQDFASGIVYITEGQTFEEADVQLGLILSSQASPEELNLWVMAQYMGAEGLTNHHTTTYGTTAACKIGSYATRHYIAVHTCLPHGDQAICVEADERVVLADYCTPTDAECWFDVCQHRLKAIPEKLEQLHASAFTEL